jgi:imidazolonepropionase-like amidohydrolase
MLRFRIAAIPALIAALCGCKPAAETRVTAIVGPVLIDGTGGAPVSDAVVLVVGAWVRAVGPRAGVPIPAGAEKIDGRGKFVLPRPIDLSRVGVKQPEAASLAVVKQGVLSGAHAFSGVFTDTETAEPAFLVQLRDLRIVFAPRLSQLEGESLAQALRATGRLAGAGVPIAVASERAGLEREIGLLVEAGLSPSDAIVAATRHGALALKKEELGTVAPGKRADLVILSGNPLEDPRRLARPERVMVNGEWVSPES